MVKINEDRTITYFCDRCKKEVPQNELVHLDSMPHTLKSFMEDGWCVECIKKEKVEE